MILTTILSAIILAQGVALTWIARRALGLNRLAEFYKTQAEAMTRENIEWQELLEGGDDVADALKWRASRRARIRRDKAAAERQRAPIKAMRERIEGEMGR